MEKKLQKKRKKEKAAVATVGHQEPRGFTEASGLLASCPPFAARKK
jgi:hypothetical protein